MLIVISAFRALRNDGPRAGRRFVNPYDKQRVLEERPVHMLITAGQAPTGRN
jgi:hypothetical protein